MVIIKPIIYNHYFRFLLGYSRTQIARVFWNNNLLQDQVFNLAARILSYNSLVIE
jgi:hypothetical protein